MSNKYAEIVYDDVKDTSPKAVLLKIDTEEVWVPLSVMKDSPDEFENGPGSIEVAEWFALKEGLI